MSALADKIKKRIMEESIGDIEQYVKELKASFDELLTELRKLNSNLVAIRDLLNELAKKR